MSSATQPKMFVQTVMVSGKALEAANDDQVVWYEYERSFLDLFRYLRRECPEMRGPAGKTITITDLSGRLVNGLLHQIAIRDTPDATS